MLREIKFLLVYFGCFSGMSMVTTLVVDGHATEMLGFVLWGNIAYAAAGFIPWVIINRLSSLLGNALLRYVIRFVSGLVVMYLLVAIASPGSSINPGVFLGITVIYILSFIIASIGYTSGNQNLQSDQEATP